MVAILTVSVVGLISLCLGWDWLRSGSYESRGATIRNAFLIIGGIDAALLAVWRSRVAERQVAIAQEGLLNERYQKGAEMIGSSVLAVRLGGVYALQGLAERYPQQYHIQIMRLLCAFVRHPTKDTNFPEQPEDSERFVLREDVQEAMRVIGARVDKHLRLAAEEAYYIDLHGADLRGGELRGLNLSSPSADMIKSIPTHQAFSNPTLRTDLSGAKLNGADFLFSRISGVDFSRNGESPATGKTVSQLSGAYQDAANPPMLKGLVDA